MVGHVPPQHAHATTHSRLERAIRLITVAVNVSSTAPTSVTNVASVSGGGSATSSANDATNISPPLYTLSGSVTISGVGLGGVTVSLSGTFSGSTVTNASGSYSFSGLFGGGTYTLSAAVAGYSFSAPVTFANLSANQMANFTGTAVAGPALRFVTVTPCRVVDTRTANGAFGGPALSGNSRDFAIPIGACGIPATAKAYALNVTVLPRGSLGYLTIWPTGQPQPYVSTLNSGDGRVKANAAIVPAGTGGAVSVFAAGSTDVVLDINGYFTSDMSQLAFYTLTPCRVVDTRNATGTFGGPIMSWGRHGHSRSRPAHCNIPANAAAYSLNLTVVPQGPLGYLTAWPAGSTQPNVSTLNAPTGAVTANAAIVPAGAGGAVSVYVSSATHVVADINGYFAVDNGSGLSYYATSPCRAVDTRNANGPLGGPAFAGQRDFPLSTSACGLPSVAMAYSLNATVVPRPALGYLTLSAHRSEHASRFDPECE